MNNNDEFYTLKGYQSHQKMELTPALEDYLEMIYRLLQKCDVVRVGELSEHLHVKPSSASKMIRQLAELGFVDAQKYGYVRLTDKGCQEGTYLLYRHEVLLRFLKALNSCEDVLEEAEQIEHFLSPVTIANMDALTKRI